MTTYYANAVLNDCHGIAVGISGYGLKLALVAQYATAVIEEHVLLLSVPSYVGNGTVGSLDICCGAGDVLFGIGSI